MSKITGVGKFIPPWTIKNAELEKTLNTSDEWIRQRTGIEERHWAEKGMSTTQMGVSAAQQALKDAGKTVEQIDAIIFATLSPDCFFPGNAVLAQNALCGQRPVAALDIRNQCSGFIYGLSVADAWIKSGAYKCIVLIGSEIHSTGLDMTPEGRDISVLFGDGAGAVVIEPTKDNKDSEILCTKLYGEGEHADKLWIQRPSSADFPRLKKGMQNLDESFFGKMDGRTVFKHAVVRMCEVLTEACQAIGKTPKDIDFLLAHQANLRINMMVMEQLGIPFEKTLNTIQKYGNTTAATLPIGLQEAKAAGMLKKGDLMAMVAFGSGFTWGASLIRW